MEAHALPRTGRLFLPRSRKLLSAFSDERLVEQIRGGNDDAFEAVFDRHHLAILSFCRHMLASADEAEDAVQQTFISAFDALRADARDIKLKPWLYTIARNRCLSILRARREQPAELDEISTAGLADEVQHRADLRDMLEDMRRLPVDQRAALVLSEIGDLSHAEVGEVVGCEAAKVKSLVFQARSSLIETRNAREIPCSEIREQLANATGGALRRGPLRRHLRACEGCSEFRDEVMRQRKALAMLLPVVPSVGFKKSALAALFGGGGGGGAGGAAVGLSGGGGLASLASSGAAVKVVGAVVVASVAVGGGIVLEKGTNAPPAEAAGKPPGAVSTPGHIRDVPGSHVRAIARHHGKRRAAAVKRGHRGKHANAQPGASTSTGTKHGGKGGAQNGAQNVPAGQTGPGAPVSQGPGATPTGPPPWSSAGGNGNGNGTPGAPGGGAQTDGGNNSGWDHSAHGGQGVGNGGTPPGTPPATTGNGNSGGNGPPPNSNAGGNGNGNANGHVNSTDG